MHELGITQEVLNIVLEQAKTNSASRITKINLVIGEASGVVDDSVRFCFELISSDSIAESAELSFKRIPLKLRCRHCDHYFAPGSMFTSCPECQAWDAEVTTGKEFYIDSIEVD